MKEAKCKITVVIHGNKREESKAIWDTLIGIDLKDITFKREPDNAYDEYAVQVLYQGEKLGYVVSNPDIALKGSVVAQRFCACLDKGFTVEVESLGPYIVDENNLYFDLNLNTYKAEEEKVEVPVGNAEEREIVLKGNTTTCLALSTVLRAEATGQPIPYGPVEIVMSVKAGTEDLEEPEKELQVYLDGELLGFIPKTDAGYSDMLNAAPFPGVFTRMEEKKTLKKPVIKVAKDLEAALTELYNVEDNVEEAPEGMQSLTVEELNERVEYLKSCGCSPDLIKDTMDHILKVYTPSARRRKPKAFFRDKEGRYVPSAVDYLNHGLNVSFNGPKATGKNTLVDTLGWLYNDEVFEISINAGTTAEDLRGGKTFETDENGNAHIVYEVTQASECADRGGILCFDEINEGVPEILTVINPMTDKRKRFELPGGGCKVMNERARIIATMNNSEEYAGTNEMNNATMGRFMNIQFEYPETITDILTEMVKAEGINPEDAKIKERIETANKIYEKILPEVESENITEAPVNIRGFGAAILCRNFRAALVDGVANMGKTIEERALITEMVNEEFPETVGDALRTGRRSAA